jgi:hypothetical protein
MTKKSIAVVGGVFSSFVLAGSSMADGAFQSHMADCVDKFASASESASVMLECNAGGGKLSDCKVVENSNPSKGFDKAALCVVAYLPIGGKTGTVRVPFKFQGS